MQTVLGYAVSKVGIFKGARVTAFVCQWTIASQAIGHAITLEEYAEWWNESRSTVFRHQAEFRAVFGLPTPQPIADVALVKQVALAHGVKGVGGLPTSVLLA
jgi:hypothetical protein